MNKYLNILRWVFYLSILTAFGLVIGFIYLKVNHKRPITRMRANGQNLPYKVTIIAGEDTISIYNEDER
jgi:hypothetical protein